MFENVAASIENGAASIEVDGVVSGDLEVSIGAAASVEVEVGGVVVEFSEGEAISGAASIEVDGVVSVVESV